MHEEFKPGPEQTGMTVALHTICKFSITALVQQTGGRADLDKLREDILLEIKKATSAGLSYDEENECLNAAIRLVNSVFDTIVIKYEDDDGN